MCVCNNTLIYICVHEQIEYVYMFIRRGTAIEGGVWRWCGCGCGGGDKSISFFPGGVVLQLRRSVSVWADDGRYVRSVVSRTHLRIAAVVAVVVVAADATTNRPTTKTPTLQPILSDSTTPRRSQPSPPTHPWLPSATDVYQRL